VAGFGAPNDTRETADKMGVVFRGTLADVERMQQQKLSHHQDIYIDDAITGGDLSRPGFLQFLADAKADSTVSTVFVFKRDRLARPQDVLQMVALERDLILSGVTLVTHDRVFTPEDVKANDIVYLITSLIEYQQHGKFSPQLGDRMIFVQAAMAVKGYSTGGRAPFGFARGLRAIAPCWVVWHDWAAPRREAPPRHSDAAESWKTSSCQLPSRLPRRFSRTLQV